MHALRGLWNRWLQRKHVGVLISLKYFWGFWMEFSSQIFLMRSRTWTGSADRYNYVLNPFIYLFFLFPWYLKYFWLVVVWCIDKFTFWINQTARKRLALIISYTWPLICAVFLSGLSRPKICQSRKLIIEPTIDLET